MNRLTKKERCEDLIGVIDDLDFKLFDLESFQKVQKLLRKLADYEDTRLEPEDILSNIKTLSGELNNVFEELKEYRNLEEQGRLIKLPCKVGQSLYAYNYTMGGIREFIARDKTWIFENMMSFGKEIFLTREEAERALEEENDMSILR